MELISSNQPNGISLNSQNTSSSSLAVPIDKRNQSVKELEDAAEKGCGESNCELGRRYLNGEGGATQNLSNASHYFENAVKSNCIEAKGYIFEYGLGVEKNYSHAMMYYMLVIDKCSATETAHSNVERLSQRMRENSSEKFFGIAVMPEELILAVTGYLPRQSMTNFSLVDRHLNIRIKETIFQKRFAKLPGLRERMKEEGDLFAIFKMNDQELARYLAKNILDPNAAGNKEVGFEEYLTILTGMAEEGYPTAQFVLGMIFFKESEGDFIDQRAAEKAFDWLCKAEAQHSGDAHAALGMMYEHGLGVVKKDRGKAFELYKKGAELGSAMAFHYLGMGYENGELPGAEKNNWKAMENYQEAIDRGHSSSVICLHTLGPSVYEKHALRANICRSDELKIGLLYLNGWGVRKDISFGEKYLRSADQRGNETALFTLGEWFMKKVKPEAIKTHEKTFLVDIENHQFRTNAIYYLKEAAKKGHKDALYTLGAWYETSDSTSCKKIAHDYYVQAVMQNQHQKAYEKVGGAMLAEAAELKTRKMDKLAINLYKPLAALPFNVAEAQFQLGLLYMNTVKGDKLCKHNLKAAAAQRHVLAAFTLANRFVGSNRIKALEYYELASCGYLWFERNANEIYAKDQIIKLGHAESSYKAGMMHKNRDKKIKFLERAHHQQHLRAAYELAHIYAPESNFIPLQNADLIKAKYWAEITVTLKIENAQRILDYVNGELNATWRKWL